MIVVADSSPIIALINIGHIDILPILFGQIVVPPEVSHELRRSNRPRTVQDFAASNPDWFVEQAPTAVEQIDGLHAGEVAAISLARELNADLLLIDELAGRRAAAERNIPLAGTVGVLELAGRNGLLELRDAFQQLKTSNFWISHQLLDERLRLFESREPR